MTARSKTLVSISMALLLSAGLGAPAVGQTSSPGQLYKWTDEQGKLHYSDTPPPPSAKTSEKKTLSGATNAVNLGVPYVLSLAMTAHPVRIYTTANCPACDAGKALLQQRGIPYAEFSVNTSEDIDQLRKAGGGNDLPFLLVGARKQQGWEADLWSALLTQAGYPETNLLPKTFRPTAVQSAGANANTKPAPAQAPEPLPPALEASAKTKPVKPADPPASPASTPNKLPPDFRF